MNLPKSNIDFEQFIIPPLILDRIKGGIKFPFYNQRDLGTLDKFIYFLYSSSQNCRLKTQDLATSSVGLPNWLCPTNGNDFGSLAL